MIRILLAIYATPGLLLSGVVISHLYGERVELTLAEIDAAYPIADLRNPVFVLLLGIFVVILWPFVAKAFVNYLRKGINDGKQQREQSKR